MNNFHQVSEYGGGARVVWAMSAGDREAEAQAKKGDEAASNDRDSRAAAAIKQYWCVGLRAVELVSKAINLVALVLHGFSIKDEGDKVRLNLAAKVDEIQNVGNEC